MYRRSTTGWLLLMLAVLALGIVGCTAQPGAPIPTGAPGASGGAKDAAASSAPVQPAGATKRVKVSIGMATDTLGYAPLYLAVRKGFFSDLGLDVERTTLQGSMGLNSAFVAGNVDLAGSTPDTVLELHSGGKDAQLVYALTKSHTMHMAVGKGFLAERGVDVNAKYEDKVSKLKGITLGAPSLGGTTELYSRFMLRRGGLQDADMTVVKIGSGAALVAAVENNQVDGFAASPPAPFEAERRGKTAVLLRPREIPEFSRSIHSGIISTKTFAEKHPEVMQKVFQALNQGKRFIREDFEGAIGDLTKDLPKIDPESLRTSLQVYLETYGNDGRMDQQMWENTLTLFKEANAGEMKMPFDPVEGRYWTNQYQP